MSHASRSASRVLILAFEPFLQYKKNITQDIVQRLRQEPVPESLALEMRVLPVRFDKDIFLAPVKQFQPDFVLGLGQCARGQLIRIERKALNAQREHRSDPDLDKRIEARGPEAIFPNWRIAPNSRSRYSYDAGRYVCNFSMYILTRAAEKQGFRYAFLHVPRTVSLQQGADYVTGILQAVARNLEKMNG